MCFYFEKRGLPLPIKILVREDTSERTSSVKSTKERQAKNKYYE